MKLFIRRFLAFFLSFAIIFSTTTSAYAASSWAMQSIAMSGATATINAAKTGFRSVISHAPSVSSVTKVAKFGAVGAFAYAVDQLLGGVDWAMDADNNQIVYTTAVTDGSKVWSARGVMKSEFIYSTAEAAAAALCAFAGYEYIRTDYATATSSVAYCLRPDGSTYTANVISQIPISEEKYIPISTVSSKIISNAEAGHPESQDAVKSAAIADFNEGILDTKLQAEAVPSDAPLDPTAPTDPSVPFDPSSIISAIESVLSAITNMSASIKLKMETMLVELGLMNDKVIAEQKVTQTVINEGMDKVVAANDRTGAKIADVVAAIEGNTLDGQVINDAVDRAIAAGNTNTTDIVTAIQGIEGNTLDGQVINDAVDRVIANDNVNAQAADTKAASDAADTKAAAEAKAAADAANTAAVTDAIDTAAAEAKEAADAKAVADAAALEWAKEAPEAPIDTGVIVDAPITDFDTDKVYIQFEGSCPPNYTASLSIMGNTVPFSFDYSPICTVMSSLKPFIVGAGYLTAAYIIAGHSRGGSKE